MKRGVVVAVAVVAGLAAGCSSSSSGGAAAPAPSSAGTSTTTPTPSASPTSGATDLVLTSDVRAQLIHAQALTINAPDSAFVRLAKGTAYYALDNSTGIYWAGASLIPSEHSLQAQVSVQDDGGYILFEEQPGGTWQTYDVGLEGTPDASPCPVTVPSDVLMLWHWAPGSCNPFTKAPAETPSAAAPSASPTSGATNLALTEDIRQQLIDARAQQIGVSDSAFTGLIKGTAYYAIDNDTGIYWAGGSLDPSRSSIKAQVSSQDEGGYLIFELEPGGSWQIFEAGLDGPGPRKGSACPVTIPADVLAVWHWQPNSCDPTFG